MTKGEGKAEVIENQGDAEEMQNRLNHINNSEKSARY